MRIEFAETQLSSAFFNAMDEIFRSHGWTPEDEMSVCPPKPELAYTIKRSDLLNQLPGLIGGRWTYGPLPWTEWTAECGEEGWSTGSMQTCPCCKIVYGYTDMLASESPVGTQQKVWEYLRIRWLNESGWTDENLRQLEDGLEIDVQALKKKCGK